MVEPARLLFDTGALIDIYRGRPAMRAHFQAVANGELGAFLSVVSEAELWRGVKPLEVERHEAILAHFTALPLESAAARLAGEWMQRYESRGLGWMALEQRDALIAATAREAGLALLTRDARLAGVLADKVEFEVYRAD